MTRLITVYICGWVGWLPVIGYPIVRWHLGRLANEPDGE